MIILYYNIIYSTWLEYIVSYNYSSSKKPVFDILYEIPYQKPDIM